MYFTDFQSGLILSLDPGTRTTGVVYSNNGKIIFADSKMQNGEVLSFLRTMESGVVAMEILVSYCQRVGQETFDTIFWSGRFLEAAAVPVIQLSRPQVKKFMFCGKRANDSIIRKAVLSMYPKTGGGITPQIGTKKEPGPLYGVHSHAIQALAVGITAFGKRINLRNLRGFHQQNIF